MSWKTIFQTYKEQEIVKKVKQVPDYTEQVSQFSLFLPSSESKKLNSESIKLYPLYQIFAQARHKEGNYHG
jgi:hypothetical protein